MLHWDLTQSLWSLTNINNYMGLKPMSERSSLVNTPHTKKKSVWNFTLNRVWDQVWSLVPFIPVLGWHRQEDLCEFETSLVYLENSRTLRATMWKSISKTWRLNHKYLTWSRPLPVLFTNFFSTSVIGEMKGILTESYLGQGFNALHWLDFKGLVWCFSNTPMEANVGEDWGLSQ